MKINRGSILNDLLNDFFQYLIVFDCFFIIAVGADWAIENKIITVHPYEVVFDDDFLNFLNSKYRFILENRNYFEPIGTYTSIDINLDSIVCIQKLHNV